MLTLFALFLAFVWSFAAWAAPVLVPTPPLVADGTTVSTVRIYVAGQASPRLKVKSDDGKVGAVVPSPDGIVTFPFTPERASAPGKAVLSVDFGGTVTTLDVPVVPPFTGSLQVVFDPPVLTSTGSATVKITPSAQSAVAPERRRFLLTASSGTVDAPVPAGNGTWVAGYTPPKGLTTPAFVVFAAADASAPEQVHGSGLLPVSVRRSLAYDAPVGSTAMLAVGDRTYGPLPASPAGKVAFDLDVDPRYPKAKLTVVAAGGAKTESEVAIPDLGKPLVAALSALPAVPERGSVRLRFGVWLAGGKEKTDTALKLTASAGTISEAKYANGAYEAVYSASGGAGEVTITAEAEGAKAEKKLKVIAGVGALTLSSDPGEIAATGTSVKVIARLKDPAGTAVPGRPPTLTALAGGTLSSVKDNGDGTYTATVTVSKGANLARVAAVPQLVASGAAAARLIAWPSSPSVAANGTDQVTITVIALDPYGLPVPNVELKLGVPLGDGSLPPTGTTGANGVGRVTYKSGTTAGLGGVRIEGAGLVTEIPLVQSKDAGAPSAPVGGPPDVEAALSRWQQAAPEVVVTRAGTAPLSGPPAAVVISTVPPYTTPGAAILVNVRVMDASGMGVGAQKLSIVASPGTVGPVTDNRGGAYSFALQLPPGVDGPVSISVTTGAATGAVSLPTLAQVGSVPARAAGPTTTTGSGGTASSGTARAPKAPVDTDVARLRVGAMLTNARGSFSQTGNGQEQFLGEAGYATPGAGFFGLRADAAWWPLAADWGLVGVDARVAAQLEMFTVLDVPRVNLRQDVVAGARYRRLFGPFSVTGGLAFHYTSGMLFRYADAALSDAVLLNFPVMGARLAGGGMLELGKTYVTLEVAETFSPFPVDAHAEAFVEYKLSRAGLRAGVSYDARSMKFSSDGGGEARVKEGQLLVLVGSGFTF